jgi:hypothetical protein
MFEALAAISEDSALFHKRWRQHYLDDTLVVAVLVNHANTASKSLAISAAHALAADDLSVSLMLLSRPEETEN